MRVIIYGLGLLSALFIGRSAFEMYVWTPVRGSQMVFYSLMHTWPSFAVYLFFLSWFAFFALLAALALTFGAAGIETLLGPTALPSGSPVVVTVKRSKRFRELLRAGLHAVAWPRGTRSFRVLAVAFGLLLLHLAAMFTYQQWSTVFDRNGS